MGFAWDGGGWCFCSTFVGGKIKFLLLRVVAMQAAASVGVEYAKLFLVRGYELFQARAEMERPLLWFHG
jgi:hypothetical protein